MSTTYDLQRRLSHLRARVDDLEADRSETDRLRYSMSQLRKRLYELESFQLPSNTERLYDLHKTHDFDLGQAIQDCYGKPSSYVDTVIAAIKRSAKLRKVPGPSVPPQAIENFVTQDRIKFAMIERAARYRQEGRKVTSAELRRELAAEGVA